MRITERLLFQRHHKLLLFKLSCFKHKMCWCMPTNILKGHDRDFGQILFFGLKCFLCFSKTFFKGNQNFIVIC